MRPSPQAPVRLWPWVIRELGPLAPQVSCASAAFRTGRAQSLRERIAGSGKPRHDIRRRFARGVSTRAPATAAHPLLNSSTAVVSRAMRSAFRQSE